MAAMQMIPSVIGKLSQIPGSSNNRLKIRALNNQDEATT